MSRTKYLKDRKTQFAILAACIVALAAMSLTGCGTQAKAPANKPAASPAPAPISQAKSSTETTPQMCADCGGKDMAPMVKGETEMEDGVQVLRIGVNEGYFEPNDFVVKAGVPVKAIFSGSAKGCLAKPNFPELGKKGDFTSGEATVDLGVLKAGTYKFTCGMEMVGGKVTVQ